MDGPFTYVDYVLMGLYLLLLLGLGFFLIKKASGSMEDYFLGGRKMPWWLLGISGMAQFVDITGTALIISLLFIMGPNALLVELRGGLVIHMVIVLLWAGKWHRRSGCLTGAEWMIFRFGNGPDGKAARIITAVSMQIFTIGMVTYLARGVGIFFSTFLPFSPMLCSFVIILIACIYTAASGFYGVVLTDLFQGGIIVVASVVVTILAIHRSWFDPGFSQMATEMTGLEHWGSSVPSMKINMPAGYEQYDWLILLAIFYLFKTLINGLGGGGEPKYFGARNDRECGTLTFMWTCMVAFRWPMMIGFAILGFYLINGMIPDVAVLDKAATLIKTAIPNIKEAHWGDTLSRIINNSGQYPELVGNLKELLGQAWADKLKMVSFHGAINSERILPAVIIHSIPMGLKGLLMIALTAACMSTFDSNVNWAVGFVTRDIYQAYIKPTAKIRELIVVSWITTFAIGGIAFVMAYQFDNINDVWGWLMMALGTGFFVPSFMKFYWHRFNGWGFFSGMVMGVGGAVLQRIFFPDLPELWQFVAMSILGLIGCIGGSLVTKPMDPDVLWNFYIITKPFGFWGTMKDRLNPELRKKVSREHFYDILSLPFTLVWHYLLMLLPVLLVIGNFKEFTVGAVIFGVALGGMYQFWYKQLPKANYYDG